MKSHARVVVIGGGVVGASVLYHLTKGGWSDVVLLERDELTSGSTWHAAGGMHTLNSDPNVAKLQQYTIKLYDEIERISGQSCGVHLTGGVMLAGTRERMDFLKLAHAKGRYLGMETELVDVHEAKKLLPLMDERHFVGGLYDPMEGHLDPSGVTHAYAKAARIGGAEIYRFTRASDLVQRADGSWDVITEKGNIHAEHVVNAGGLWAREVGRMVGLELPVLAMEHMYLLTEDMPEVAAANAQTGGEMLHCIDFEGEIYIRQEGAGMLMGTYERAGKPWSELNTPWQFGHELLQPDLERIAPSLEVGFRHFPAFQNAGIKQVINGPFTFAPDGNPLIGPVRGMRNFWLACAVMAGFSQGGGVGLALANWIIEGDPGFDIWGMDAARYGDWASLAYTNAKVRETYSRRFRITFPNEELAAGRPLQTTAIYDRLESHNAVFGASYGLEHALWFAPHGEPPVENVTFRRSNAFGPVARECAAVRTGVGVLEISNFAKYQVTGPAAGSWLSHLMANRMPRAGRIVLTPMLNDNGRLIGDFTVANLDNQRFFVFGSGVAESYHMRWFGSALPKTGVQVRSMGLDLVGLSIAGPRARDLLGLIGGRDISAHEFTFMSIREMDLGLLPAMVGRITFTGELGYEIWVRPEYLRLLHEVLLTKGKELGLRHFGARALNSLRLEKSFGTWAREYRPIYSPYEAGLDRFVALSKNAFVGRDAAVAELENGPARRLVVMKVEANDADAIGDEPIWHDGSVIGWVTSGGYAHHSAASLAMGYVPSKFADVTEAAAFQVEIIGEKRDATILKAPMFDPSGALMRS